MVESQMKNEEAIEKYKNKSTDELKKEYVILCLGALIYGAKTENKRREIAFEIERREKQKGDAQKYECE